MSAKGLGPVLDSWMERAGLGKAARAAAVIVRWPEIVGEPVAVQARAQRVERGVLTVRVGSSVWATELSAHIPLILERITEMVGDGVVREIRFVSGSSGRCADRGDPATRFASESGRATGDPRPDRLDLAAIALSPDERERVRRFSEGVPDPDLARVASRWLALTLKARRWREEQSGRTTLHATPRR